MGGIVFKNLIIKNGRVFDDVVIPLENQGLVSIQGDNGTGKSSIWDILETIIYGSTPDGYKKDELTKNDLDSEYTLTMEKNAIEMVATLKRVNKKWSYNLLKDGKNCTDHTYYEAIKSIGAFVGLTKNEFEGSVHLTQSAQHMLIKGSLSERKDYISAFFDIDNRYDEVHTAAKIELEKVTEKISRLSALSHSKQMLENELKNLTIRDLEPEQNKLNTLQANLSNYTKKLDQVDNSLRIWQEFKKYDKASSIYENPTIELEKVEILLNDLRMKITYAEQIRSQNLKAKNNNDTLDMLLEGISNIITSTPQVINDTTPVEVYEKELTDLEVARNQNNKLAALRQELANLPDVKELPISRLEEELVKLQVAYQTFVRNKNAKEKGICPECGSNFTVQDVHKDIEKIKEVKDQIDLLSSDYQIIKTRNSNVKRRQWIVDQLSQLPEFSDAHSERIIYLRAYLSVLKKYRELDSKSKLLTRMPVEVVEDTDRIIEQIKALQKEKSSIEACILAKKMKPTAPAEKEEDLQKLKSDIHNNILSLKNFIANTTQAIGEYKSINESHNRIKTQLVDIEKKLTEIDGLKKEEYFWCKMVEAYGPRGLRIEQLENRMDLILTQLPVYVSILFNEKSLTFKHRVDANNVKILANRKIVDAKKEVINSFEHDIGCFSGGEKDLMSAAFILTLADCIPLHKRANILVLDEVDSQFDEGIKFRFTNELLPLLKRKYSSIFVISHDKNVQLANIYDQIWRLNKKNHKSTIEFVKI